MPGTVLGVDRWSILHMCRYMHTCICVHHMIYDFISLCNNLRREIIFYLPFRYEETKAKEGDHILRKYWRQAYNLGYLNPESS